MKTDTHANYLRIILGAVLILTILLSTSCSASSSPTPTDTPAPAPTESAIELQLEFSTPSSTASTFKEGDIIIADGTHNLPQESFVWIFLKDSYGGYYLQSPAVDFYSKSNWEATNIRLGKGIISIVAILVDVDGNNTVEHWVATNLWGQINENEIKGLSGYRELNRIRITVE